MPPIVLLIRDGWGHSLKKKGNAIRLGKTIYTDYLLKHYPKAYLDPHGKSVGLPTGSQGSSEVGHLNMGAGRIVHQDEVRIDMAIKDGSFFNNKALVDVIDAAKGKQLHLMGLLQDQGVHAHQNHLFALLKLAKQRKFAKEQVKIHIFSDGRDTPPRSAKKYIKKLEAKIKEIGIGQIVSLTGRYYAMDRDKRWERVSIAYNGIVHARGKQFSNIHDALADAYACGEDDEFIKPRIIGKYSGVQEKDGMIFYNYRLDRGRELTQMIVEKKVVPKVKPLSVHYAAMCQYYSPMSAAVAFENEQMTNILGQVLAENGKKQLRISETEKYAHVTYFFNSLEEKPFKNEKRIMIYSPKVATYDMQPEMSIYDVTKKLIEELPKYDVIICNLVNGDMVGHTGVWKAVIKAVNAVDKCVEKICKATLKIDGTILVTADHGNCEQMFLDDGTPMTSHTINLVHLIGVSNNKMKFKKGIFPLASVAPTILDIIGLQIPSEMTVPSVLKKR